MDPMSSTADNVKKIIKKHNKHFKEADVEMHEHLNSLIRQVHSSVWIYLGFYIILFLAAIVLLFLCLNVLWKTAGWDKPDYIALAGALISLYLILMVTLRNPIRLFRQSLVVTSSMNLIYMNFSQQLTQADTRFRLMAQNPETIDQEELNSISENIQVVLDESMQQLRNVIEELE